MRKIVEFTQWKGPLPIKVAPNEARMVTGEDIKFTQDSLFITRADNMAVLILEARMNENFYDEERGYIQEINWTYRPRWSDGAPLTSTEITDLAGKVEAASSVLNCWIHQVHYLG